jgi:hypothetical protein
MLKVPTGTLGLFKYEFDGAIGGYGGTDGCVRISNVDDTALKCAQVCSILALVFGAAILFFGVFKQCLCNLPFSGLILSVSYLCVQISLALVWVIYDTSVCANGRCEWSEGATYLIVAQALYFVSGIFTYCLPEPRYKRCREEMPEPEPKPKDPEEPVPEPKPEQAQTGLAQEYVLGKPESQEEIEA